VISSHVAIVAAFFKLQILSIYKNSEKNSAMTIVIKPISKAYSLTLTKLLSRRQFWSTIVSAAV
jgi:hypothetical protein